ncbi:MAG: hypothetical protein K0U24_04750 [Gammaproteobacteria bacterium]|nr:hypothetical protein [Gammaproteobacteria bacterium]MCH9715965.1 hypothetical protein [Gammaproteobacteria bacterium]MCH9763525.1 hypothetical protein [Gammaproteobacteria bacterium]
MPEIAEKNSPLELSSQSSNESIRTDSETMSEDANEPNAHPLSPRQFEASKNRLRFYSFPEPTRPDNTGCLPDAFCAPGCPMS